MDGKGSFADIILKVIISSPFFFFSICCYKIKTFFPLGCLSLLKWETWWIMAHLLCYALSASLEMMHDLNFTEGKKNIWTPSFLSSLFTSEIVLFLLVAQADHLLRNREISSKKLMVFLLNSPEFELWVLKEWYF